MELKEIVALVQRNYKSSQAISLLGMYCQKFGYSMPVWTFTTNEMAGCTVSTFNLKLEIQDEVFETWKADNKIDAKKACAKAAVQYFKTQGIMFFVDQDISYSSVMTNLAQIAGLEPPSFVITGTGPFHIEATFNNSIFKSNSTYTKKSAAKDDICRIIYDAACNDKQLFDSMYLNNPSLLSAKDELLEVRHCSSTGYTLDASANTLASDQLVVSVTNRTLNFIELLFKHYEMNPFVGKPFYNSRTVMTGNEFGYKSQLIVGVQMEISDVHKSRFEADNQVAERVLHKLISGSGKPSVSDLKKAVDAEVFEGEDPVYYSDNESVPSYEHMLLVLLKSMKLEKPSFDYLTGSVGIICQAKIRLSAQDSRTFISLREHSARGTAREDVCHDIYIVLSTELSTK